MSNLNDHLLDAAKAQQLAKEYEDTTYARINSGRPAGKPDSRFYIHDLDVLQDYINMIRDEMEKKGIRKKGIRITLGKYPESRFDPRLNPEYKGYQTIFFSAQNLDPAGTANEASNLSQDLPALDFGSIAPPYTPQHNG